MRRKLKAKAGKAVYAARKAIVEPVFGQIKRVGSGSFCCGASTRCVAVGTGVSNA